MQPPDAPGHWVNARQGGGLVLTTSTPLPPGNPDKRVRAGGSAQMVPWALGDASPPVPGAPVAPQTAPLAACRLPEKAQMASWAPGDASPPAPGALVAPQTSTIYEVDPYAAMRWQVYSAQFVVASLRL